MNIKDIAAAAGVSVSTVSKVLNKKDRDISEATRQHVLKVIREYQYSPYANIRANTSAVGSHILAMVIIEREFYVPPFIRAVESAAAENGFNLLLCCVDGVSQSELERRIKILLAKKVDGIFLCANTEPALQTVLALTGTSIPVVAATPFAAPGASTVRCDFYAAAHDAVEKLTAHGHRHIGFVMDRQEHIIYEQVYNGITTALSANAVALNTHSIVYCQPNRSVLDADLQALFDRNITAVFCQTAGAARKVQDYLLRSDAKIPSAISLICGAGSATELPDWTTSYWIPYVQIARSAVELLVTAVSSKIAPPAQDLCLPLSFHKGDSITSPPGSEAPIIVLGNCAFDTILTVPKLPQNAQLILSSGIVTASGGKCVSQAIAVSRLGGCAYAIGRVGNDPQGRAIINTLLDSGVHTEGIVTDSTASTGSSYLTSSGGGEYAIISYPGANRDLDVRAIKKLQYLLPAAYACLISTEIPYSATKSLIQKCIPYHAKIFLKPSEPIAPEPTIMRHIDYFIPNETELDQMLPGDGTVEEKAERCYRLGCKNVIVTLANNGCYLKNEQHHCFIPAANFKPVETAAAANCFIGALAISLSENNDLLYALSYATYAAGISISQYGMYSSFPYRQQMDLYLDEINVFYQNVLRQAQE